MIQLLVLVKHLLQLRENRVACLTDLAYGGILLSIQTLFGFEVVNVLEDDS